MGTPACSLCLLSAKTNEKTKWGKRIYESLQWELNGDLLTSSLTSASRS